MEFFRGKLGMLAAFLCLAALAGIVWFCLFGADRSEDLDGTLVYEQQKEFGGSLALYGKAASDECESSSAGSTETAVKPL